MMKTKIKSVFNLIFWKKKRHSWLFMLLLIPSVMAALLEGLSFGLILFSFQMLTGEKNLAQFDWFSPLLVKSWLYTLSNHQLFVFFIVLAILAQVFRSLLTYGGQISFLSFSLIIQKEIQRDVYMQILKFSFPFANKYKVGDLLEYVKIPSQLITCLLEPLNRVIISGFAVAVLIGMMFFISIPLTVVAIFVFGGLSFSQKIIIKKISSVSRNLTEETVEFSRHTTQSFHGLRMVHTFARGSYVLGKIYETLEKITKNSRQLNFWAQAVVPINETMGIILVGIFLVCGQFMFAGEGKEAVSMLLTFIVIVHRLNTRLQMLLSAASLIAFHWGSIIRLKEILDEKDKEFNKDTGVNIFSFKNEICFKNVFLTYPNALYPSLQELNFKILKGKVTAFVGASGAGKSSIIDLILGLYKPTQGTIGIDGTDMEEFYIDSWRNLLGVVSQDIFIFPETIEENIRFGHPEASFSQIFNAASISGAHDFICRLPDQYGTLLGERGYRLSGGEKQKLALARALVRDPEILILDEASSSLDSHSELLIQNALSSFKGKKTMVIIAHRLSTIKNADLIFVIERGKIVESGSHAELMQLRGRYASFGEVQSLDLI